MRVKKFGAFGGDGFMITLLGSTEDGGSVAPGSMVVQEIATYTSKDNLRHEIADLLFFVSTLAVDEGIEWQDIVNELRGRR